MKKTKHFFRKIYLELINTGERPIVKTIFEDIRSVFRCAYEFAGTFAQGKSVLDFGCGGGYGTEYLSRFTDRNVVGFDIDKPTIRINNRFFNKRNLSFISEVKEIKQYDMVVFCQVIEHLKEVNTYLEDISKNYLKLGGVFICSTPNKLIVSPALRKPIMVFHMKEYTPSDLQGLLEKYFKKVTIFGQCDESLVRSKNIKNDSNKLSCRQKILRTISQIEIVRILSRHLLMFIKYAFMGRLPDDKDAIFVLVEDKQSIDRSEILIAKCET